jgi:hypothetical protein
MTPAISIQESSSPGACLDDLLDSRFLRKRSAARIRSANELPHRLQQCVQNLAPDAEWRAYGDGERTFFAIARARAIEPAAPEASVAIDAYFLDDNASVYCAGVWEYDVRHGWWLDATLQLSYDCDHGWWFEALEHPSAAQGGPAVKLLRSRP